MQYALRPSSAKLSSSETSRSRTGTGMAPRRARTSVRWTITAVLPVPTPPMSRWGRPSVTVPQLLDEHLAQLVAADDLPHDGAASRRDEVLGLLLRSGPDRALGAVEAPHEEDGAGEGGHEQGPGDVHELPASTALVISVAQLARGLRPLTIEDQPVQHLPIPHDEQPGE